MVDEQIEKSAKGPNLGNFSQKPTDSSLDISKPKRQINPKKKLTINSSEILRKSSVITRRVQKALQTLMGIEYKTNVPLTSIKKLYHEFIDFLLEGQLTYLKEMIDLIEKGDDDLSQLLMEKDLNNRASTQVFETLVELISDQKAKFNEEKVDILKYIDNALKKNKDKRMEPRTCFWVIVSTGLQLQKMKSKIPEEFDIVLSVLIKYKPAIRRSLGVFLYFCYHFINEFPPYQIESCRIKLVPGPTNTGYNMASWLKYRYGTNSQSYMNYNRFIKFFCSSFGKISGNAPDIKNGPKQGYRDWINRTLTSLEKSLRTSPLLLEHARGDTLEGMIIGLKDELEEELQQRKYDNGGKLTNYPKHAEFVPQLLEWLFETALNRYTTTNIVSHGPIRLNLDMFLFIPDCVRWVNEYGERIVSDWLEDD